MNWTLPGAWAQVLADEVAQPYFAELRKVIDGERARHQVFPPASEVFRALELTPYERVRVVLLGQDPYHDDGQAHGLCFSVPPGVPPPPSLVNIFRELTADLQCAAPPSGDLTPWARQGVLLLNTVLTVRAHRAHSHRGKGWERFTDAVICRVAAKPSRVVFVLWGKPAQQKARLIDTQHHAVIPAAHPSPLSATRGFFGSRPFSAVNQQLRAWGQTEIDWCLERRW
jgi:uracil-DNA glycosylase